MSDIDPETGADREAALRLTDEHRDQVQRWIDEGVSLVTILYVLGTAFVAILAQAGAPRGKVERLRNDILKWINSTQDMADARGLNRAQRHAQKATKH